MSLACWATPRKKFPPPTTIASLHPELVDVAEFGGDLVNASRVDAKALVRRQSLSGQLEQNAFEDRSCDRHGICSAGVPTRALTA